MRFSPLSLIVPAILVAGWQIGAATDVIDEGAFSRPTAILAAGVDAAASGALFRATWETLIAAGIGLAFATVVGFALGVALGFQPWFESISRPVLEVLRAIPAIAFTPLALLVFGFGLGMESSVVAYACIWPIMISTMAATRSIARRHLEVAATLELSPVRKLFSIIVPAIVSRVAVGFRTAIGFALIVAVTVEILANPSGLGYALIAAQQAFRPDLLYAYLVWLAVVGVAVNALATRIVPRSMEGVS